MAKNKKQKTKKKLEIFLKLTTWKNLLRLMVKIIAIVLRQLTQNKQLRGFMGSITGRILKNLRATISEGKDKNFPE